MHGLVFVLSNDLEEGLDFMVDVVEVVETFYEVDGAHEIENKEELINVMKEFIENYKVGELKMTENNEPYVEINVDDFLQVLEDEIRTRIERYIEMLKVAKNEKKPWVQLNSVAAEAFELFWPSKFIYVEKAGFSEYSREKDLPYILVDLKERSIKKIYLTKVVDIHM
jgi:hypothetical protein